MDFPTRKGLTLQAASQAQIVRAKCEIKHGAVIDPISVAERLGCEVRFMALPSLEGLYSPTPRPVIVLGSERPAGRRAYTCAHEIGHNEFKHGTRIDEFVNDNTPETDDPDEFLANMFAAFLLMPKGKIQKVLKERKIQLQRIEPLQIFQIASHLNVGYGTLITHMTWTLNLLSRQQCKNLLRTQPREMKARFGGLPQSEVIIVDGLWQDRTVDLEIGDILVLHGDATLDETSRLSLAGTVDGQKTYRAAARGYARAFDEHGDWAVNIRIASKHYEGLARFRYYADPEEEI
jgi:Zn-dependent peptidase ImmA (M78 family)